MPNVNKNKKRPSRNSRRRKARRSRVTGRGPIDPSVLTMSNTGGLIAPMAAEYTRPEPFQRTRAPTKPGAEAALSGCDFIGTVSSLTTEQTIEYVLNLLNSTTFPRGCAAASIWRRYLLRSLTFHLFGISAATQQGFCAIASIVTDDLGEEASIGGETEVLNMEGAAIVRPWSAVSHVVNCKAEGLKWYTCSAVESATKFGESIGRAFLYVPATTVAGDIQVQVYVSYEVEFSQRVAYQTMTPTASLSFITETMEQYYDQVAVESSEPVAADQTMMAIEDAYGTSGNSELFGILGESSASLWEYLSWYSATQTSLDSLGESLGSVISYYIPSVIPYDEGKYTGFMASMFLRYLTSMAAAYGGTRTWTEMCQRVAWGFMDAVDVYTEGDLTTIRNGMIASLNAYSSSEERRIALKSRVRAVSERKAQLLESRISLSQKSLQRRRRTKKEASKNLNGDPACVRTCFSPTEKKPDPVIPFTRCLYHPDSVEGRRIWCTICENSI